MTDAAIQSISLVVIALFAMLGPILLAYMQLKQTRETRMNAAALTKVAETVAVIKTQTDGLTTALVKKTEEKAVADIDAAKLAGKEEGRIAGEAKEAAAAAGRAEARIEARNGNLDKVVTDAVNGVVPASEETVKRVAVATEAVVDQGEKK